MEMLGFDGLEMEILGFDREEGLDFEDGPDLDDLEDGPDLESLEDGPDLDDLEDGLLWLLLGPEAEGSSSSSPLWLWIE